MLSAHFERVARYLCETFPKNFAGLHPCGQKTGEWFYERPDLLNGYDPATRAAFRRWLKERGDPEADAADVPTPAERRDRADGLLLDPVRSRRIVEFNRFQQEEMADTILAIARACRRGSDGKKLVVLFYGYGFELSNHRNGAASSGHLALGKVLREGNDVIDVLCGPNSYTDRSWLGTGPVMSAAETISRAGILWLNEDDTRTHLFHRNPRPRNAHGVVADLNQTRQVLLRNTAQAALRGFGTWWMDLFGDGWYDDEAVWREMVRLRPLDEAMLQRKSPFAPEIAAILDEDGMCHLADGARVASTPLIYHGRAALGRCGAPYGQYLLNDVLDDETPARMQVFLSAWRLTADQRKALAAQRDGRPAQRKARQTGDAQPVVPARVWCWAPGYLYPDRADVAGIEEVTGFAASAVSPATAEVAPTELGLAMGLAEAWGPAAPIQPLFSVVAAPDEVLATYSDGSPAVAMRRSEAGIDVFVGTPQLTPELIHAIAKASGVHLFTQPGPTLWAAEGYLSVQSHASGPLLLDTGCMQPVVDALDGTLLGNGPLIELNMEQGEVRILQIRR